ncbi:MAG: YkvA family protein [Myxococcota bacterium]
MTREDALVEIDLNERERRLYDRLRSQLVRRPSGAASGIPEILLLMPDLAVLLIRLMRDDRVPPGSKAIAMVALGYLFSPMDLLPELLFGPIAWIDDLVVVGTALSRMLNHVHPDVVRSHWSGQGDALEAIQRVSAWTEDQLFARMRGLLRWSLGRQRS